MPCDSGDRREQDPALPAPRAVPYRARFSRWQWMVEVEEPVAALDLRGAFLNYLFRYATPESDLFGAELIFGELLGNVVRYAPGRVAFHLDWHGLRPTLLVVDEGDGFRGAPGGGLSDLEAESGRGLALVRAFAVEMLIGNRPHHGAYVSVILPVRRADAKPAGQRPPEPE
ncbi:MAG: hypothetical protein QOI11_1113 [Candidatus Eremiobacteraeota bacterium]|nr:hypothetical protein [Candidatus Eremiobacteraeota bacterium]